MTALESTRAALPMATAGVIAVANLESSWQRSWHVLSRWPARSGTAEQIVEEERLRLQFLGDISALDRLVTLDAVLCRTMPEAVETHLVAAQVASMRHEFDYAVSHLEKACALGVHADTVMRVALTIWQARGERLGDVLEARRQLAADNPSLRDLVPLGALLADLGQHDAAEQTYLRALDNYTDVSPFPLAWVCFQLGVLYGETIPDRDAERAATWYGHAVEYLPDYTHARIHLAEIHLEEGQFDRAEDLLRPIEAGGDPEARWRLAEVLAARGMTAEANILLGAARAAFEAMVMRHELAFADHAAAFYLDTGLNPARAFELARINLVNRPTVRAFNLAHAAAVAAGSMEFAGRCSEARGRLPDAPEPAGSSFLGGHDPPTMEFNHDP